MMPYDSYRLYGIEHPKSPAGIRRADEQAGQLVSPISSLFSSARSRKHRPTISWRQILAAHWSVRECRHVGQDRAELATRDDAAIGDYFTRGTGRCGP